MIASASEIAELLGLELKGEDVEIRACSELAKAEPGELTWLKKPEPEWISALNSRKGAFAIVPQSCEGQIEISHVLSSNPKWDFVRTLRRYWPSESEAKIESSAVIDPSARIAPGVSIGHFSVIDAGVSVGEGTRIGSHCVIKQGVAIGARCIIKSHAVIGEDGFGFAFDEEGKSLRMPHLGSVIIGDDVEIGSFTSVMRGSMGDTVLQNGVKIDDLVLIAHNVELGEHTLVAGGATVAGTVKVGAKSWIGAHSALMNGIKTGEGVMVGLGGIVFRSVKPMEIVVGHNTRHLRTRRPGERFA